VRPRVVNLPPRVATGARWVAVATTTEATAAHGRRGTTVAGSAAVAASTKVALRRTSPAASVAAESTATTTHATNIAGSSVTAATTSTTTSTAATEARALTSDRLEELRNLLVGLLEEIDEVADNTAVTTVEESSGNTSVSCTSGTTDAVNVIVDVGGQVVVDHVGHIGNTFLSQRLQVWRYSMLLTQDHGQQQRWRREWGNVQNGTSRGPSHARAGCGHRE
jgi:hypothetical protein